jgi:hypothetical protein
MFVVILMGGYDLPQAYGPFKTEVEAQSFADTVPTVDVPVVTEVEAPSSFVAD